MSLRKLLALIIVIASFNFSCKKLSWEPVLEIDPDFAGRWFSGNTTYSALLMIETDGTGYFLTDINSCGDDYESWSGNIVLSEGNLKIGNSPEFRIIEFPTPIDTMILYDYSVAWEMKLQYPNSIGNPGEQFTIYKE